MSCLRLFFLNPIETSLKNAPGALYLLIGLYAYECECACEEHSNRWNISQTIHNLTFEGYKSKHVITWRKWKKNIWKNTNIYSRKKFLLYNSLLTKYPTGMIPSAIFSLFFFLF